MKKRGSSLLSPCPVPHHEQWRHTCDWDLSRGHVRWFEGARLNVTANCLDRHVEAGGGSKPCLTFEHDDGSSRTFTYSEVLAEVSRLANALRDVGVRRGSRVTIYLPMVPELPFTMLACARIGAVHSVVFGGFSSSALADRIVDCARCVSARHADATVAHATEPVMFW